MSLIGQAIYGIKKAIIINFFLGVGMLSIIGDDKKNHIDDHNHKTNIYKNNKIYK